MFKYRDVFNLKLTENLKFCGPYDLPIIKGTKVIPDKVISFNYANSCKTPEEYFVHFYIDDYQFERIWKRPEYYLKLLKKFKGIISPDFSTYTNMPKAQQIFQVYKSRLISAYYERYGIDIIPNISWSDEDSLSWTLEGIPKNSIIALSTNGVLNKSIKDNFIQCYKKVIEILEPKTVIIIGDIPEEIKTNNNVQFENRINHLRKINKKE